jgi:hypothetical protein
MFAPFGPNDNNFKAMSNLDTPPSFYNASIMSLVKLLAFLPSMTCSREIKIDNKVPFINNVGVTL